MLPNSPFEVFVTPSCTIVLSSVVAIGIFISNDIQPLKNVFSKPGVKRLTPTPPANSGTPSK